MHINKCIHSATAQDTLALARRIGLRMPAGAVIAASGDLGAGKTVFAAGLAQGLGIDEPITSPTFIYFNEYNSGRLPFVHIDAYRLENMEEEEIAFVGLDDCFRLNKAVFVEWPQFIRAWLPQETVQLRICRTEDDSRLLCFDYQDKEAWLHEALSD